MIHHRSLIRVGGSVAARAVFVLVLVAAFAASPNRASAQATHYVWLDAAGSNNGTSWANAFTSLQDALASAVAGDAIWVSAGTYRPDVGTGLLAGDRSLAFEITPGVRVHGGFSGTESSIAERDLLANTTVLSGDLADDDDGFALNDDNAHHVVRMTNADDQTLLDGFTVVGGAALSSDVDSLGGGILMVGGEPWITNTRINSNMARCGGGVAAVGGSPTLVNVVLNGNRAGSGGAMCNIDATPNLTSATVTNNTAALAPGIYNTNATLAVANSIISANQTYVNADHCEIWQYPCASFHVSDSLRDATRAMMAGAHEARKNGTMEDAAAFLESYPEVVEVLYGETSVAARLRGGAMSSLLDLTGLPRGDGRVGKTDAGTRPGPTPPYAVPTEAVASTSRRQTPGRTIVGEDLNGSGRVDNQDGKRALIINPFDTPDGELAPILMVGTPGYAGNIEYRNPFAIEQEGLDSWFKFQDYDFIYLSTVGYVQCREPEAVAEYCRAMISTGVEWRDDGEDPPVVVNEDVVISFFDTDTKVYLSISTTALVDAYQNSLDNAVVYCAYCDIPLYLVRGYFPIGTPANNFEFWTWTDNDFVASHEDKLDVNVEILSSLPLGRSVASLRDSVAQTNVAATYLVGPTTQGQDTRIRERPTLLYDPLSPVGGELPGRDLLLNLTDISTMSVLVNDVEKFPLITRIGGYNEARDQATQIRYFFDGDLIETIPAHPSQGQTQVVPGTNEQVLFLAPLVPVPEALKENGIGLLEVSVDVPEGGESWYGAVVTYEAFSCRASAVIDDTRSGAFTGAAQADTVVVAGRVRLSAVTLESTATVLIKGPFPESLGGPGAYTVSLYPGESQDTGETGYLMQFDLNGATVGQAIDYGTWNGGFFSTGDCEECGGFVGITEVNETGTIWSGEFAFVGEDITSRISDRRYVEVAGTFTAVVGSAQTQGTPYFRCLQEYWNAVDPAASAGAER